MKNCAICAVKISEVSVHCRKCAGKVRRKNIDQLPKEELIKKAEDIGKNNKYAFGYIIGVMLGDGCVVKEKMKKRDNYEYYKFKVAVISENFIKKVRENWNILVSKNASYRVENRIIKKPSLPGIPVGYQLTVYVFQGGDAIMCNYLHHIKYTKQYELLLTYSDEVHKGILDGMIDSEGYYNEQGQWIQISNKDMELLGILQTILSNMGKGCTIRKDKRDLGVLHIGRSQAIGLFKTENPELKLTRKYHRGPRKPKVVEN